jgi:uncharacterized membrane protein
MLSVLLTLSVSSLNLNNIADQVAYVVTGAWCSASALRFANVV